MLHRKGKLTVRPKLTVNIQLPKWNERVAVGSDGVLGYHGKVKDKKCATVFSKVGLAVGYALPLNQSFLRAGFPAHGEREGEDGAEPAFRCPDVTDTETYIQDTFSCEVQ